MIEFLIIIGIIIIAIFLTGCNPINDSSFYKWQKRDITTERWQRYVEGTKYIVSDNLLALEMKKKNENGEYFYRWASDWDLFNKQDYWDLPDEVYERGLADCDGFAALTSDIIGRFIKLSVYWIEHYGYYRQYYQDSNENWQYKVKFGGHAITVYEKNNKLLVFSNTSWWNNENFQDYVEIAEKTFPEGVTLIRCRHWENGKLQWTQKANNGEILEGSNIFERDLVKEKDIKKLDKTKIGEMM